MTTINLNNVKETFYSTPIISRTYGCGVILDAKVTEDFKVLVTIAFEEKTTTFDIAVALAARFIRFVDAATAEIANKIVESAQIAKYEAEEEAKIAKLTELKLNEELKNKNIAEEKARKEKAKYERARKAAIEKFESMYNREFEIEGTQEEYYVALGWLAANIGTISARLPDYLETVFTSHFGSTAPKTLVNTKRKTISGFKPQWSYAFSASIKNANTAPMWVIKNLNTNGKLANTALIWNLIDNHNFQFGRTQNIKEIMKTIPDSMVQWFEVGMSLS